MCIHLDTNQINLEDKKCLWSLANVLEFRIQDVKLRYLKKKCILFTQLLSGVYGSLEEENINPIFFLTILETLGYAMAPESALRMEVFGAPPAGAEGA